MTANQASIPCKTSNSAAESKIISNSSFDPKYNQNEFFNRVTKNGVNLGLAYLWELTDLSGPSVVDTGDTEEFKIPAAKLVVGKNYSLNLTVSKDIRNSSQM